MGFTIDRDAITLLIAAIGMATGVASLMIQFFSFLHLRPRVKVEIYRRKEMKGFYNNQWDNIVSKKVVVMIVTVKNMNNCPASLNSILVCRKQHESSCDTRISLNKIVFSNSDMTYNFINTSIPFSMPYLLAPMETLRVPLVFPFVNEIYDEFVANDKRPIRIKLKFQFTHKVVTVPTFVREIDCEILEKIDFLRKG